MKRTWEERRRIEAECWAEDRAEGLEQLRGFYDRALAEGDHNTVETLRSLIPGIDQPA